MEDCQGWSEEHWVGTISCSSAAHIREEERFVLCVVLSVVHSAPLTIWANEPENSSATATRLHELLAEAIMLVEEKELANSFLQRLGIRAMRNRRSFEERHIMV